MTTDVKPVPLRSEGIAKAAEVPKVLLVEDEERDAELVLRQLKRAGLACESRRVQSELELRRSLLEFRPDIVLSDFSMPGFNGMAALRICRELDADLPFIFMSGTVGEDVAVEAVKAGANDYVMKTSLARLGSAVQRELREAAARKQHKEALTRLRLAIDHCGDMILMTDRASMRHVYVNDTACKTLGYSREELLAMGPPDILPLGGAELEKVYDELIANPSQPSGMKSHYRCKDGSRLPFESTRKLVFSGDTWLIVAISRDIRERLAAEQALRESEAGLRQAQGIARLAHAVVRMDGSYESTSASMAGLLGLSPGEAPRGLEDYLRYVHPEDLERVRETVRDAVRSREAYALEYRIIRTDGCVMHIRQDAVWLANADGSQPTRRFATIQDVTERREAEAELRDSESLKGAILESSLDCIITIDHEGRIVEFNPAAQATFGVSRDQALGKPMADLIIPPHLRDAHRRGFAHYLATGEGPILGKRLELQAMRADGSEFPIELAIVPIKSGSTPLFTGFLRDITVRKEAEDKIKHLNRVYAVLSGINTLIVRAHDRDELVREACRIAVEAGGFRMAWLGMVDRKAMQVTPLAWHGAGEDYIRKMPLGLSDAGLDGRGMAGRAVRERRAISVDDMTQDPRILLRREAAERGLRSLVMLPLVVENEAVGVLALYAGEVGFFDDDEMKLLVELAGDISFALEHIAKEEKVARLTRVQTVMSGINTLIARVRERKDLLTEACRLVVEKGGFRMAWVGMVDHEAGIVKPMATAGEVGDFFANAPMAIIENEPGGQGLAGRAVRDMKPIISNDVSNDPQRLMKKELDARGINAVALIPLIVGAEAIGVLALYAGEVGFFDDDEMKLLLELAGDISFALDHLAKGEKLDYLAYYDPLTGLANRTLFQEHLGQFLHTAEREQHKLALLIFDIERFKSINDTFGRQAGDALLKQLAERMVKSRGDSTRVARLGADHFALVLPRVRSDDELARRVEKRLQEFFGEPFQVAATEMGVSARLGIALFPQDGTDGETLFKNAEAALKKAKSDGERYLFYTEEMTARVAGKLSLENKLRRALEKEEFVFHYQPKVEFGTRTVVGVEALLRWQSPDKGLIPPLQFIPLLEETGLILQVGAWALKRAALDHRSWVERKLKAPRVAVNVSAIQLRQRDFVWLVEEAIMGGVAPTAIDLEITESLVMEDIKGNIAKLKAVRDLGVQIAIDDFGTGYSSLAYLAQLPVQYLKIDRSFIVRMQEDPNAMTLVSTMISLAHSLRLKVVAEGVETEDQARFLRLLRCDQMQGYLFSKPLPGSDLETLLAKPD